MTKSREIKDPVRVSFLGEVHDGEVVNIAASRAVPGTNLYQVLLHNNKNTCLWFSEDEVMDAYVYP